MEEGREIHRPSYGASNFLIDLLSFSFLIPYQLLVGGHFLSKTAGGEVLVF